VRSKSQMAKQLLHATVLPIGLLVVWELLTRSGIINPQILPAPSKVFLRWIAYAKPLVPYREAHLGFLAWIFSGELPLDLFATSYRVVVGFLIGAGLALPLGLFMGTIDGVYKLFNPLIQILRPIPP